jgi:hypothetical protein
MGDAVQPVFRQDGCKTILAVEDESTSRFFLERAMGIELHPKFLSLTETGCYLPLCVSQMLPNVGKRRSRLPQPFRQEEFVAGAAFLLVDWHCAVNLHNAVTVAQNRLGRRVAQLSSLRMSEICAALRFSLGCDGS